MRNLRMRNIFLKTKALHKTKLLTNVNVIIALLFSEKQRVITKLL